MSTTDDRRGARRWVVPGLCVLFAAGYAAVFLAGDRPLMAAIGAAVMLAYGLVLVLFSRRSEAVALLRDPRRASMKSAGPKSPRGSRPGVRGSQDSKASGGGQEQTRLRSP